MDSDGPTGVFELQIRIGGLKMPKIKTHSASKKRFRITGTGKVKMNHAFRSHRLISKARKAKKQHRLGAYASSADEANIKKLIPYK
jgi:large subunit ribosomal protein L35